MISTAAICDRTKGESISRRNAHGLCYQLRWVCYWQHWCRLSYATVCVTNVQMDQNAFQAGFVLCVYVLLLLTGRAWQ